MRINTGCFLNGCKCFDPDDENGVGIKANREWQGLTEDEVAQAMFRADAIVTGPMQFKFAKEIEAKLKEKNT